MFLKPFRIKTQSALKNSDRKKLRVDIRSQYPALSEDDALALIPNKVEMNVTKVSTHGGDVVQIYFVMKNPIIFESYRKVYPTVYCLWQFPDLVPVFKTWPPVFDKLLKGADLMLPGVIPEKEHSPKMFGDLKRGDVVSVSIAGNLSPVALGNALLSGEDMYLSALRGKGVGIMHIFGDALWEAGDKSQPPSRPEPQPCGPDQECASNNEAEDAMPSVEGLQIGDNEGDDKDDCDDDDDGADSDDSEEKDPVAEMDELLQFCFTCAIKSRIKDKDLPVLTVNLMRDYMQPFSPAKRLDIKKSSYKRLSRFLIQKVSEAYITTKEQTKGVAVITSIDRTHPGLQDVDVPEAVEEETANEAAAAASKEEEVNKPLTFTDVHCVNAATFDLFKGARLSKGDALRLSEVRELVMKYIQDNDLQHKDNTSIVTLEPVLAHIILKSNEGDLVRMPQEQVINRVVGKMQSGVAISSSEGLVSIKRGKLEPIKMDVVSKASNKKMTVVENLEEYGFDLKAFARTIQRAVSSSSSVFQSQQKNKGPQVQIQGNQISYVGKCLIEKYNIPKKYVVGMDKAPKQKMKR